MAILSTTTERSGRQFKTAAEWHHALGDVPLERIRFDPTPGTATEADLLRLLEGDKILCELIDGTLVEKPVGFWEGQIAARLIALLFNFVDPRGLGAVFAPDATMRMKSGRVRLPDVSFIARDRLPTTREAIPTVAPDLAVEVLSESNTPVEIAMKLAEYFQSGVRLAWIIDPRARNVAVFVEADAPSVVVDESGTLDGGHVLPGFQVVVSELFKGIPV